MSLELRDVWHAYDQDTWILKYIDLSVSEGNLVALTGPSGSGKSTLLGIAAGAIVPTRGTSLIDRESALDHRGVALIHQSTNVLVNRTIWDNVLLPLRIRGRSREPSSKKHSEAALESVGLLARRGSTCGELSGGEVQRVCVARAIASRPAVIIADEPTGHLDAVNTQIVISCLKGAAELGAAVLLATHDDVVARSCDRSLSLEYGEIRR